MASSSPSKRPKVEHDGQGSPSPGSILTGEYAANHLEDIFAFLTGTETIEGGRVCPFWRHAATSDAVWKEKCARLWADKVHVPKIFTEGKLPWIDAYWGSIKDSKRICLTAEELCEFEWSSRMKGCAGPNWQATDPWWQGKPAAVRKYSPDGTTQSERGPGVWRFIEKTIGHEGPYGSLVRHSRGGHDFPTHFASRWTKNWGWILQNCWGFSASFALPARGLEPDLEDGGEVCRRVTVNTCQEEAMLFNMGVPLPEEVIPDLRRLVGRNITVEVDETSESSSDEAWGALAVPHGFSLHSHSHSHSAGSVDEEGAPSDGQHEEAFPADNLEEEDDMLLMED